MLASELNIDRAIPAADAPEESGAEAMAALCKASSDPLRLMILKVLQQDSFGVLELCQLFDIRQPAMSHHLKVLAKAGMVASRREGNSIYYRRALPGARSALSDLQRALLEAVDQLTPTALIHNQLLQLQQRRIEASNTFFQQNAEKFRAQQDLIASYSQYAETIEQLLDDAALPTRQLAIEIGPGDGAFLSHLSPAFNAVLALDNSQEMLDQARNHAAKASLGNVEFVLGDTAHTALDTLCADAIVVNMVLHHTPSPADILKDLARCLAPTGVLLVTDLCSHDQAWAREACGDLWLGFDPADLQSWAEAAGLEERAGLYLAQRNGFQIQVRLFGHPPI